MKLQLVKTQAKEFLLQTKALEDIKPQQKISINQLNVNLSLPEEEGTTVFAILFKLEATAILEEQLCISCEYWAFFESDSPLTQEFLSSPFTSINAPAIAYPYLRSFITHSLVNAGYPALYLPTVNFVELAKKS